MKVLYITNIPSPYRVDFFNELGKYCDLTVIFERKMAGDREETWQSFDFQSFQYLFLNGKRVGTEASFCPEIIRYLNKQWDWIIFGGYSSPTCIMAIEYLRWRRIPFCLNADGGIIKQDKRIVGWLKKHLIGSASSWLSTGDKTSQYLCHYGAKREKIYNYPFTSMGKADLYFPSEEEKKRKKRELHMGEGNVIATVGQFIPRKGFDLLIEASKKMKCQADIYIIGGNAQTQYESSGHIHFVGFLNKAHLKDYYIAADVFAFPTREDIWGLVLNEAISYGLPVVSSTKAVASYELIREGENGFLVDPENTGKMADLLDELLSDDEKRRDMGRASFEISKEYTIEEMAQRHLEIGRLLTECAG